MQPPNRSAKASALEAAAAKFGSFISLGTVLVDLDIQARVDNVAAPWPVLRPYAWHCEAIVVSVRLE